MERKCCTFNTTQGTAQPCVSSGSSIMHHLTISHSYSRTPYLSPFSLITHACTLLLSLRSFSFSLLSSYTYILHSKQMVISVSICCLEYQEHGKLNSYCWNQHSDTFDEAAEIVTPIDIHPLLSSLLIHSFYSI